MGKKSRAGKTRTVSLVMNSRQLRRHPERLEEIRPGRKETNASLLRAFHANGFRKG